ncbi:hypothetical protein MmTuc01_3304 [Methanosarcina mazei Tuc01]|uniref:Uncharacterized protein n=1 Tax=Methanosarcina mazei Tuc01 TaxID=1236903 RepID=M1QE86_METMZ|nr:hypothetical protein MmTuc01_3304 [Methanosarcina mazei Tuc01]
MRIKNSKASRQIPDSQKSEARSIIVSWIIFGIFEIVPGKIF